MPDRNYTVGLAFLRLQKVPFNFRLQLKSLTRTGTGRVRSSSPRSAAIRGDAGECHVARGVAHPQGTALNSLGIRGRGGVGRAFAE
jgi:hypothetical protein